MPTTNYINNRQNFEPSQVTRIAWIKTRKQETRYGSTSLPGMFGTTGFSTDTSWIILAGIIELAAVVMTILLGYFRENALFGAVFAVVLFLVLDYVGILLHTHQAEDRAKWKNQILIAQTPQDHAVLKKKLSDRTLKEDTGVLFLFLSGFLKVLAISILNKNALPMMVIILFAMFYLIVIYIHASHTGYWFAKIDFNKKLKADYAQWSVGNGNEAQVYLHNFKTPFSLQMKVGDKKTVNCQTLECVSKSGEDYHFKLISRGLMWDQDIATLCMGLLYKEMPVLALECLQLQLTQIVANGSAVIHNENLTSAPVGEGSVIR